jgi:acyl-CoA reductase-like NAD-dependent aldehyde dehydrogenase
LIPRVELPSQSSVRLWFRHFDGFYPLICLLDPATGEELGTVPEMGLEETKEAIDAAGRAFTTWSRTTAKVTDLRS